MAVNGSTRRKVGEAGCTESREGEANHYRSGRRSESVLYSMCIAGGVEVVECVGWVDVGGEARVGRGRDEGKRWWVRCGGGSGRVVWWWYIGGGGEEGVV